MADLAVQSMATQRSIHVGAVTALMCLGNAECRVYITSAQHSQTEEPDLRHLLAALELCGTPFRRSHAVTRARLSRAEQLHIRSKPVLDRYSPQHLLDLMSEICIAIQVMQQSIY